jgi:2-keto-4-pentenoate hydratase/2-oxohepta-3-ene-1,7-dioic acid hydratase in catechol pathway
MRIGAAGSEKPVARIDDQTYVDLSDVIADFDEKFFGSGGIDRVRPVVTERAAAGRVSRFAGERIGAPIARPHQILCIGLNYRDHAIEGGKAIPTEPVLFAKFPNTLIAHGDPIVISKANQKVDYEAELVIVIGKKGKHIPNDKSAFDYVGGYTVGHDVSDRYWQFRGEEKQWVIGKTPDTFAPTGPVLVTADELTDPHSLQIQLRLNGKTMQNSNTKEFIFQVPHVLWYVSQMVTLEPGDLIFTGTPPGVGIARNPQVLLKPGDVCEVEIEKIGVLKNAVVAES